MMELKPRILIVDDDTDILNSRKLVLQNERGFAVYLASNSDEATAIASQTWLDLAVIDISLVRTPRNKEGFSLAQAMDPAIPKIIYTAHSDYAMAREVQGLENRRKANIVSVVEKTGGADPLLEEIDAALRFINPELVIHWGSYSPRSLIEMLKGYKKRSEDEKQAAEGELQALLGRMFNDVDSVTIIDLKAGKGGCAVARVDPRGQGWRGSSVVVKFGPREKVEREWENYEKYVKPFVSHGATVREDKLGRTLNLGAIKYSFIGGDDFALYYRERSLQKIVETLDDLFRENCGPWYLYENQKLLTGEERQPLDLLYRRKDHLSLSDAEHIQELRSVFDQLLRANNSLAPHFRVEGEKYLQITLGDSPQEFPNPIEFGLRRDSEKETTSVFPSGSLFAITHGDLNSSNILVSKEGKPCLIDFYKTGYGHIFRDIAELESVIKFELLDADSLLIRYQLEIALVTPRVLTDVVSLEEEYAASELTKAVGAINKLRQLAGEISSAVSLHELREYQTALLFYALKEMVGFSSGADDSTCCRIQQYHALVSAAIICRELASAAP
jgi:DNA-binding response OmpR family regulator